MYMLVIVLRETFVLYVAITDQINVNYVKQLFRQNTPKDDVAPYYLFLEYLTKNSSCSFALSSIFMLFAFDF